MAEKKPLCIYGDTMKELQDGDTLPGGGGTAPAAILTPEITSLLDGATGVSRTPTITLSTYYSLYGKPQQALRIQISTASDFATKLVDETVGAVSEYTVSTALGYETLIYIRGAYQDDDDVWSDWSQSVSCTTTSESQTQIIGVALRSTGGPGGTWDHIDVDGNTISTPSTAWFDLHQVFGNIEDVTVDGQYMVNVPKFYYKRGTASNGDPAWWMSNNAYTGFSVMPAFVLDGVEKDSFQYGKYQASESGGKLQSVPGVLPKVDTNLTTFISLAEARNTGGVAGFRLHHYDMRLAIQWLYLIENATMDSQTETGDGRVNESSAANVDATDVAQATYRGIVGLWGNVQQWMDGVRTISDVIERRAYNGSWASTGESVPNSGDAYYPITFRSTGDEQFIADTYSGSNDTTATIPDYTRWRNAGEYYPFVGGSWSYAASAGLWYVACYRAASYSFSLIGARLARVL
jgi:hypothetical protein